MLRLTGIVLLIMGFTFIVSCKREERTFRVEPPYVSGIEIIPMTNFRAGGQSTSPTTRPVIANDYEENAYTLSEGKRLFTFYNCTGCHFHGGGGIGPPLMDDKWIYGSDPGQIFATIMQGRPNGMPSFAGKVPDYQAWQLAAYVRSVAGLTNPATATSRSDHMSGPPPENSMNVQAQLNTPPSR